MGIDRHCPRSPPIKGHHPQTRHSPAPSPKRHYRPRRQWRSSAPFGRPGPGTVPAWIKYAPISSGVQRDQSCLPSAAESISPSSPTSFCGPGASMSEAPHSASSRRRQRRAEARNDLGHASTWHRSQHLLTLFLERQATTPPPSGVTRSRTGPLRLSSPTWSGTAWVDDDLSRDRRLTAIPGHLCRPHWQRRFQQHGLRSYRRLPRRRSTRLTTTTNIYVSAWNWQPCGTRLSGAIGDVKSHQ